MFKALKLDPDDPLDLDLSDFFYMKGSIPPEYGEWSSRGFVEMDLSFDEFLLRCGDEF